MGCIYEEDQRGGGWGGGGGYYHELTGMSQREFCGRSVSGCLSLFDTACGDIDAGK